MNWRTPGYSLSWRTSSPVSLGALSLLLFERPKSNPKAAGLVLTACRSITRFAKPLKTRSSSLRTVASSSSNTTSFATPNELAVSAQFGKNVDGRCVCPDPAKGRCPFMVRSNAIAIPLTCPACSEPAEPCRRVAPHITGDGFGPLS